MTKAKLLLVASIVLIALGLVVAGYPVYLWAEGWWEQRNLEKAFQQPYISSNDPVYRDGSLIRWYEPKEDKEIELPQWDDFPPTKIIIPSIDVDVHVVKVDDLDIFAQRLNHPPGYYPQSAFPGEIGNVLIAGHRDGPAGHFLRVNRLEEGDSIILQTPGYNYIYHVKRVFVTEPTDLSVIDPTDYAALTLTTCQRVGTDSSAMRLIVTAELVDVVEDEN